MAKRWNHFEDRVRNVGLAVRTTLGQQEWLDRPSYRLEHGLMFLFAATGRYRDRISNVLHGTWLGSAASGVVVGVDRSGGDDGRDGRRQCAPRTCHSSA